MQCANPLPVILTFVCIAGSGLYFLLCFTMLGFKARYTVYSSRMECLCMSTSLTMFFDLCQNISQILDPPPGYVPVTTPAQKLMATPLGAGGLPVYAIPEDSRDMQLSSQQETDGLPDMKPEDYQYFGKLLKDLDEADLSAEDAKERKIMRLLLKVFVIFYPLKSVSIVGELQGSSISFRPLTWDRAPQIVH